MKESDFVSYDLAILIEVYGFRDTCNAFYSEINGGEIVLIEKENTKYSRYYTLAPTKIQAKKWLEKHNIKDLDDELK